MKFYAYRNYGEHTKKVTLNEWPQCGNLKLKKNVICSQCKARSKLRYVQEGRITPKITRETYYCQNADCDRRGQELPKKEMIFKKHLWLCRRCE